MQPMEGILNEHNKCHATFEYRYKMTASIVRSDVLCGTTANE